MIWAAWLLVRPNEQGAIRMSQPTPPLAPAPNVWEAAAAAWLSLNPMVRNAITSVLLVGASWAAAWAYAHGLISQADEPTVINDLVGAGGLLLMALFGWLQAHSVSQTSMIKAVNDGDNGVKVVADTAAAAQVNAPLK
jgi:hypothetical protein